MRDSADVRLRVKGREYGDIERVVVTRSIEQLADDVDITLSEKWLQDGSALGFPIKAGDDFELVVDSDVLVTGFISSIPISYSATDHMVSMSGLSRGGHLATSSYTGRPRTWREAGLDRIVRDVLAPYEIDVKISADIGEPFSRFAANIGETSWSVVERALQKRGLWMMSLTDGNLEIVEAGTSRYVTPILGPGPGQQTNVLRGAREDRFTERHDRVIVVGQSGSRADWTGDQAIKGVAIELDPGVETHRPLVIQESGESGQSKLQARAQWEVRTRAGRARPLTYTMPAWATDDPGMPLWEPNRRVRVNDPKLDVEGEYLISAVSTTFGQGTTADLSLSAPEAFELLFTAPKKKAQARGRRGKYQPWA